MPTNKPRLTLCMSPQLADTLSRLSALQERTRATLAAEVMEGLEPSLRRVAQTLEAVRNLPSDALEQFTRTLDVARADVEKLLVQAQQIDLEVFPEKPVLEPSGAGGRSAQRASPPPQTARRPDPRPVTRGSAPPSKGRAKRAVTPGKKAR